MSTYVISDIHGCLDEFLALLKKISFSAKDHLILAGDYIDRGPKSFEILEWMGHAPQNITFLKGNHDEEFASNVDVMNFVLENAPVKLKADSAKDTKTLYRITQEFCKEQGALFDYYRTMGLLVRDKDVTLEDLRRWAAKLRSFDYLYRTKAAGRDCVIVHAGYIENLAPLKKLGSGYQTLEEFYIYARDEGYKWGGLRGGMVVSGHTPTIAEGRKTYTGGKVFRFHDKTKDCIFYDIDCGCCFWRQDPNAKLAALRLEDEKIFYYRRN